MMSEIELVTEIMMSVAALGFLAWIVFYYLPFKNKVAKSQRRDGDAHRINSVKGEDE